MGEHYVDIVGVASSILAAPTIFLLGEIDKSCLTGARCPTALMREACGSLLSLIAQGGYMNEALARDSVPENALIDEGPGHAMAAAPDQISLYDLVVLVASHWRLLAVTTSAVTMIALAVALFSSSVYRSSATVAPQALDVADKSSLSSLSGGLGGLASLAGLGSGDGGSIEQNLALLKSRILAETFIAEQDLGKHLFPDEWDAERQIWKKPSLIKNLLRRISSLSDSGESSATRPGNGGPTPEELWRAFDDARDVILDKESGLVTVSFENRSAKEAARLTTAYLRRANEFIRTREITEAKARLGYLSNLAATTTVTEIRDAISTLMESELKRSMLANVREEFAFKTIDPAYVPELRAWPKRGLLLLAGIVGGMMLGIFLILLKSYIEAMRNARKR